MVQAIRKSEAREGFLAKASIERAGDDLVNIPASLVFGAGG